MAVVTVIIRKPTRLNVPGKWGAELWFYGINKTRPGKNAPVSMNGPTEFVGNFSVDLGPAPNERAIQMAHFHAMGIISKDQARRIIDLGSS